MKAGRVSRRDAGALMFRVGGSRTVAKSRVRVRRDGVGPELAEAADWMLKNGLPGLRFLA
jgi:hypothetical protein